MRQSQSIASHSCSHRYGMEKKFETEPESSNNVNSIVEELCLDQVIFIGRCAVKLFSKLVGLRTLKISDISYQDSHNDDELDEEWKTDRDCSNVWKDLMEQNPQLKKLVTHNVNESCLDGLLEAACIHNNLEYFEHSSMAVEIQESRGAFIGRLFQQTKSLKHMQLNWIRLVLVVVVCPLSSRLFLCAVIYFSILNGYKKKT
jgi:hypothetical protein